MITRVGRPSGRLRPGWGSREDGAGEVDRGHATLRVDRVVVVFDVPGEDVEQCGQWFGDARVERGRGVWVDSWACGRPRARV